ncbi:hypothetical protein CVU76_03755 [Candidatus Dojkabacteria bacterium HGW-Dojkabacteria-1]|uniref:Thymidylate kinase-like domain-containing protein n=1 Tax=Candidatus Dojkabacteria bacterium HGW-Dojkabacteria-1 TaxID=2013761 RepID=A0A2N2F4G7_9BACT|nr:MAG: hypothetical protein CVU76_03755 [Candidatus Dojkabacteria bacterium HGW-Dojkabacteria-1]
MSEIFSIDVEGGDQVGKGDAVGNIAKELASEGYDVCIVSFPCYATPVGNAVREVLKNDHLNHMGLDSQEALSSKMALFALNRLEVLNFLIQQKSDCVYVFDRGPFSNALTIAYAYAKGLSHINSESLVEEALSFDSFFRQKMLVDNCVIRLFNNASNWSKEREDGDLHESKDVQDISEGIYRVFGQRIGGNWVDIPSKDVNGWRSRVDICNESLAFIKERLRLAPKTDSKHPKHLSMGDMLTSLYSGSRIDVGSLYAFVDSIACNEKGRMYEYSDKIAQDVVSSVGTVEWYNGEIRGAVKNLVDQNPSILTLLENLYGEIFVAKFVKSLDYEEEGTG